LVSLEPKYSDKEVQYDEVKWIGIELECKRKYFLFQELIPENIQLGSRVLESKNSTPIPPSFF